MAGIGVKSQCHKKDLTLIGVKIDQQMWESLTSTSPQRVFINNCELEEVKSQTEISDLELTGMNEANVGRALSGFEKVSHVKVKVSDPDWQNRLKDQFSSSQFDFMQGPPLVKYAFDPDYKSKNYSINGKVLVKNSEKDFSICLGKTPSGPLPSHPCLFKARLKVQPQNNTIIGISERGDKAHLDGNYLGK